MLWDKGGEADTCFEIDRPDSIARSSRRPAFTRIAGRGSALNKRDCNWHSMAYVKSDWAFENIVKGRQEGKSQVAEEATFLDNRQECKG